MMNETKRIVIVGGSAAGPKAAAKARRMDQHAEITIIQKASDRWTTSNRQTRTA